MANLTSSKNILWGSLDINLRLEKDNYAQRRETRNIIYRKYQEKLHKENK